MDRSVYNRLLQSINLEIQTAFQVSQPIRPFQTILGERVNGLVDTLKPKEISSMYKRWCILYHLEKQTDRLVEERREEATNVINFGIIIQNSEQVKQLSFLIFEKFSYSLKVAY